MRKYGFAKIIMIAAVLAVLPLVTSSQAYATTNGEALTGKTIDNLEAAFNGESNAHAMYTAFAEKAKEEGYIDVYNLFRATAKAEEIHAGYHAKVIRGYGAEPKAEVKTPEVKTTAENLKTAIEGETYEKETMYPGFVKQAELEKDSKAVRTFKGAMAAEVEHAKLYTLALNNLAEWKNSGKKIIVCGECGYTTMDLSLGKCPVCSYPRNQFIDFK